VHDARPQPELAVGAVSERVDSAGGCKGQGVASAAADIDDLEKISLLPALKVSKLCTLYSICSFATNLYH
jgi:hypothetical protein